MAPCELLCARTLVGDRAHGVMGGTQWRVFWCHGRQRWTVGENEIERGGGRVVEVRYCVLVISRRRKSTFRQSIGGLAFGGNA